MYLLTYPLIQVNETYAPSLSNEVIVISVYTSRLELSSFLDSQSTCWATSTARKSISM